MYSKATKLVEGGTRPTPKSVRLLSPGLQLCGLCWPHPCDWQSQNCWQLLPGKGQLGI